MKSAAGDSNRDSGTPAREASRKVGRVAPHLVTSSPRSLPGGGTRWSARALECAAVARGVGSQEWVLECRDP